MPNKGIGPPLSAFHIGPEANCPPPHFSYIGPEVDCPPPPPPLFVWGLTLSTPLAEILDTPLQFIVPLRVPVLVEAGQD